MIVSRALPTLIAFKYVIKLTNVSKPKLSSRLLLSCPEKRNQFIRIMSSSNKDDPNDPAKQLDYDQLIKKKDKGDVIIIDVREHAEVKETGQIPGSIHIPLKEVSQALGVMSKDDFMKTYKSIKPGLDDEIIFSCKAGGRSFSAMKIALDLGYMKALNYKGGWTDWAEKTKKN